MLAKPTYFDQETRTKLIDYSMEVEGVNTPDEVLNRLDAITSDKNPIRVHGANKFSVKLGDWRRIEVGKNVFVHRDVPRGWLEEWVAFVASGHARPPHHLRSEHPVRHIHCIAAHAISATNTTSAKRTVAASQSDSSGSLFGWVIRQSRKIVGPHLLLMRPHYGSCPDHGASWPAQSNACRVGSDIMAR